MTNIMRSSLGTLVSVWLLWSPCSGEGPAPLVSREVSRHRITARMVTSPKHCTEDKDCGDTSIFTCDPEERHCACKNHNAILSASGDCLLAKSLGEACTEDVQCQHMDKHAVCTEDFCACDSGFHQDNETLCKPEGASSEAHHPSMDMDRNMIIVMVVLAIMFIGICVALHLFSKARFGNRRTIFNSPHPRLMHIKLGKRKKSSLRTHHLPPPGHPVPRHHSFSGHHSPYPMSKVPKTRSQECLGTSLSRCSSPEFEPRCKTAPLAEKESLPSTEDLEKKTPTEPLQNGPASLLGEEETRPKAPGSPTVIITDADGAHTVVANSTAAGRPSSPNSAVNV